MSKVFLIFWDHSGKRRKCETFLGTVGFVLGYGRWTNSESTVGNYVGPMNKMTLRQRHVSVMDRQYSHHNANVGNANVGTSKTAIWAYSFNFKQLRINGTGTI